MERRIGIRRPIDVRNVTWEPEHKRQPRFRLRKAEPATARLVDLSITGAAVIAPSGVQVGERVSIAVGNRRGIVAVRRAAPLPDTGLERYGVEFLALDEALTELVSRTVDTHDASSDWRWATAR